MTLRSGEDRGTRCFRPTAAETLADRVPGAGLPPLPEREPAPYRPIACYGQATCTPLVPEVMLNLVVVLYQPPTKIALLSDAVSRLTGSPVVSQ
jgi:hypothetical protein